MPPDKHKWQTETKTGQIPLSNLVKSLIWKMGINKRVENTTEYPPTPKKDAESLPFKWMLETGDENNYTLKFTKEITTPIQFSFELSSSDVLDDYPPIFSKIDETYTDKKGNTILRVKHSTSADFDVYIIAHSHSSKRDSTPNKIHKTFKLEVSHDINYDSAGKNLYTNITILKDKGNQSEFGVNVRALCPYETSNF